MNVNWRVFVALLACVAIPGVARSDQFGGAQSAGYDAPPQGASQANWTAQLFQPPVGAGPQGAGYDVWPAGYSMLNASGQVEPLAKFEPIGGPDYVCEEDCIPPWAHRSGIFGELLYLRARDAEVAYAVPVDGAIGPPPSSIQVGPVALVDPDYSAGFRVGAICAMDDCSSLSLTYSRFQSSTFNDVSTTAPLVLRSLIFHPGTANAGSDFLDANASLDVDFDLVDGDYRAVWAAGDLWAINYLLGVRYAHLQQALDAEFLNTGTVDTVVTDVTFEGAGFRFGLDGERHMPSCGLLVYGRAAANIIAGETRARYTQGSDVDPVIVNTSWEAGRLVTILDMELGVGWQSACGHWRLTTGYLISGWYNAVATDQWIQSVRRNNFVGLGDDTITFDGLTARAEYRF